MNKEDKQWDYDAFISYRHLEPDAYVAGVLHKLLESYKLPGNLVKANGEKLKRTKITKVFRDAEELPLTSNLNDTIIRALEGSEYFIAICSPKYGESLWCKKEVDTFIEMRGIDHVLTVLVEGEPSESFPEVLLYRNVEVTNPDGTKEIVKEPIEPLAANARGANNKERLKLLKTEYLRLMAPMFGCSFDDLKQRHREQKVKRIVRIVSGVAAVCLAFGIVSTTMALRINNQKNQISEQNYQILEQNNQILTQNEQIAAQAQKIEEQYKEALVNTANAAGDYSRTLLESGDRIGAMEKAFEVLATSNNDLPYVPKVEYVLSDALNLYENGTTIRPDRQLVGDSVIDEIFILSSGEQLVAKSHEGILSIWDIRTSNKIDEIQLENNSTYSNHVVVDDKNGFFFENGGIVYRYDTEAKSYNEFVKLKVDSTFDISYSAEKNRLLVATADGGYLYDTTSGSLIASNDYKEEQILKRLGNEELIGCYKASKISQAKDNYYMLVFEGAAIDKKIICIYDTVDGHMIGIEEFGDETIAGMKNYGNNIYISAGKSKEGSNIFDADSLSSIVCAYEISGDSLRKVWEKNIPSVFVSDIYASNGGNGKQLACQSNSRIEIVDRSNGSTIRSFEIGSSIKKVYGRNSSDDFMCITRDGRWLGLYTNIDVAYDNSFWKSNSDNIAFFDTLAGCVASVPYNSNVITIYRTAFPVVEDEIETAVEWVDNSTDPDAGILDSLDKLGVRTSFVDKVFCDKDNRFLAVSYRNKTIDVFRLDDSNMPVKNVGSFSFANEKLNGMVFSSDGKYMLIGGNEDAYIFTTKGIDLTTSFPDSNQIIAHINKFEGVDFENACVYVENFDKFYRIPIYTTEEIAKMTSEELKSSGR